VALLVPCQHHVRLTTFLFFFIFLFFYFLIIFPLILLYLHYRVPKMYSLVTFYVAETFPNGSYQKQGISNKKKIHTRWISGMTSITQFPIFFILQNCNCHNSLPLSYSWTNTCVPILWQLGVPMTSGNRGKVPAQTKPFWYFLTTFWRVQMFFNERLQITFIVLTPSWLNIIIFQSVSDIIIVFFYVIPNISSLNL